MELNRYYSFEKFINLIFVSRFFNEIVRKYDIHYNQYHSSLVKRDQINFYHLISFLYYSFRHYFTVISKIKKPQVLGTSDFKINCPFCLSHYENLEKLSIKWAIFFESQKNNFSNMFNVCFEIDKTHCKYLFRRIKINYNTVNGSNGFDLNNYLLENIKALNNSDIEYKGILYSFRKESPDKQFQYYLQFIQNLIYDFKFGNKKLFVLPFAVGTNLLRPNHWSIFLIDFYTLKIFFYNSLAKEKQLCKTFTYLLIDSLKKELNLDFSFIKNNKQQQTENKLCAIFVTDFAIQMLKVSHHERENFFQKNYNCFFNRDRLIEKDQNKYIEPLLDYMYETNEGAIIRFLKI